ncbi:TIGR02302 family protein [Ferrovibrio sp.]|uniref:TIGR02302 family protein n=1 Tax=Ferrovibrio sp. TaxID=1917215 RepID=UPI0026058603|nr:TIGR02302 family protein [Ferrovibrio sp.]
MVQRGAGITPTTETAPVDDRVAGRVSDSGASLSPVLAPVLERRLALARAALFWESFWPGLMPAGGVIAVFLILAGFDVWRFTPVWLHWLALAGFAGGIIAALWQGLRHLRWPDRAAAMRRLERVNLLDHRPLEAAADTLAAEQQDPIAQALWALHRRRALEKLAAVRVGTPEAGWWRRDSWGLRAALGLLLIVAWASPGEDRAQRLADTLKPGTALPAGTTFALDAWITPPAYTGRAPLFLSRDGKPVQTAAMPGGQPADAGSDAPPALAVPTGSLLKLRLAAPPSGFSLRFGAQDQALQAIDERNGEIDLALDLTQGSDPVLVLHRRDKVFASWPLRMMPDLPPIVAFAGEPKAAKRGELDIAFEGEDDYGIHSLRIEMRRDGAEQPQSVDWPAPPAGGGAVNATQGFDFTAHPWAGLQVSMTLVATDALGQVGRSAAVVVTLPARRFLHPVAKAIVEQRRELALKPAAWSRVVTALQGLSLAPERYRDDVTAHLGLRMSAARLRLNRGVESVAAVQDLLWQTALHIEDGRASQADRDFQALMDRLQDAIDRNADDEEIQKLMQELQQAMDRMLEQMLQDALDRLARGEQPEELGEDDEAMSGEDLQDMMDQAQDMARMGDRDQARDMLQQMQRMLEAMKNGRLAIAPQGRQGKGQRGQRGQGQAGQMMQEFGDMMRQQQQLLDRSFRRSQQYGRNNQPGNQPGGRQPGGENEADARQQEELRRKLGEMMGRLAERGVPLPDQLGRADRSMRDARESLRRGEPGEAMQGQTDALDQLRQGLNQMQQAQRGNPDGQAPSADARQNQRNQVRDPLGRNTTGYENAGEATAVPDLAPVERARRILEELQRRAGNRERSPAELDYLERLLRRF